MMKKQGGTYGNSNTKVFWIVSFTSSLKTETLNSHWKATLYPQVPTAPGRLIDIEIGKEWWLTMKF